MCLLGCSGMTVFTFESYDKGKTTSKGDYRKTLLPAAAFLLLTIATILIQVVYWKDAENPHKRMLQVGRQIQRKNETIGKLYFKIKNHCRWNADGLEDRLKYTIGKSMEKLRNITSIIAWSADALQAMKPNETELFNSLVNKETSITASWNETINLLIRVHDVVPEKLLSRLRTLSTANEDMNNVNLTACVSVHRTRSGFSCIAAIYETYSRYFSRLENELEDYSKFCDSLSRTVENVIKSAEEYTFPELRTAATTTVNNTLDAAGITMDTLVAYTRRKVEKYKEIITTLMVKINYQIALADAIFSNRYKKLHHYGDLLRDTENLAVVTLDILVYNNMMDTSVSADFKDMLLRERLTGFTQLTKVFNDILEENKTIDSELTEITEKLSQHGILDCDGFYIYDCLTDVTQFFANLHKRTELLYSTCVGHVDPLSENLDFSIRKTQDDFNADVYKFISELFDRHDMDIDDALSYEIMLIQKFYSDTVQNITVKRDEEFFSEMQRKFEAIKSLAVDSQNVVCDMEGHGTDTLSELRSSLTTMKNILSARCNDYSTTIASHVTNIRSYKLMDRLDTERREMTRKSWEELCLTNDESVANRPTVINALDCLEKARTKTVSLITVIADFYSGMMAGVTGFYSQYLHQMHSILRMELTTVLNRFQIVNDFDKLPAFRYLLCLRDVDIIQWDATKLESALKHCRSHMTNICFV